MTRQARASGAPAGRDETTSEEAMAGTHGGRIIAALEQAWAAIQARHPEVPPVVLITGTARQRGGDRWGHIAPRRWVTDPAAPHAGRLPELFVAGEALELGGTRVVEVLLHEAAHGLAVARGIKDTSADGNRYHNKRFAALAAETGLRAPGKPAPVHGFAQTQITDETAAAYAAAIAAIDTARLPYLDDLTAGAADGNGKDHQDDEQDQDGQDQDHGRKRAGRRLAAECACDPPRRIQLTPRAMEDGPIICGLCGAPFEVPAPDDDHQDDKS